MTAPIKYRKIDTQNLLLDGTLITATADEINAMAGSTADVTDLTKLANVTASAAELNALDGAPLDVDITVGVIATRTINVAIQLNDAGGTALATRATVQAFLSDDANGDSIAAVAPDGNVVIGADGLLIPVVANKAFWLVSEADGSIDLDITMSTADEWYLIIVLPNGLLVASGAITFPAP